MCGARAQGTGMELTHSTLETNEFRVLVMTQRALGQI